MLSQALPVAPQKPVQYASAQNNQTEFQLIFAGLFLAYKNFISSQDFQRCQFQPSCSEYGMIAVKQKGILIGMLSTFDRLLRCNSLPTRFYPINPQGNAWLDPVE